MPRTQQTLDSQPAVARPAATAVGWTYRMLALAVLATLLGWSGCITIPSDNPPGASPSTSSGESSERQGLRSPDSPDNPSPPAIRESDRVDRSAEIPATLAAVARALEQSETAGRFPELPQLRQYMLDLINQDREAQGLNPVALGNNPASQFHAEDMLEHGYISHWGTNGLKPYMRYTLAGGTDYEAENVSRQALIGAGVGQSLETWLDESQEGLMNSPGHRRNILNKWHQKVNLGIACTPKACSVVQQFQGDYVEYFRRPEITGGVLSLTASIKDRFDVTGAQVWYDQPPHPLTLGQLDHTFSYGTGQYPVTFIRPPLSDGFFYTDSSSEYTWETGVDPYQLDPNATRIDPICQDDLCSGPPKPPSRQVSLTVPWVTAETWEINSFGFDLAADIGPVVKALGAGVYTVIIWGERDGESVALTSYAIFVE